MASKKYPHIAVIVVPVVHKKIVAELAKQIQSIESTPEGAERTFGIELEHKKTKSVDYVATITKMSEKQKSAIDDMLSDGNDYDIQISFVQDKSLFALQSVIANTLLPQYQVKQNIQQEMI